MVNDPIADMLTRIRNANQVKLPSVKMPSSNIKVEIAKILLDEGFITGFNVEGDVKKELTLNLKYAENGERVIKGLKRISSPGLRVNVSVENIPYVRRGLGIAIISTSKGLLTDAKARKLGVGGEVMAYVW